MALRKRFLWAVPRILCIETSTHLCSAALCDGNELLAERNEEERKRYTHAERLHVLIHEAMAEANATMRSLEAVAVGIGPGSYTGLRIGLSAAKGFCYALGVPIIGVNTLHTLVAALGASTEAARRNEQRDTINDQLHPMIDARRMEVFTGDPPRGLVLSEEWIATLDPSRRHIAFGDGADKAVDLWKSQDRVTHVPGIRPLARAMAGLAMERFDAQRFDDLAYLVPLYGKEPNVTQAKP